MIRCPIRFKALRNILQLQLPFKISLQSISVFMCYCCYSLVIEESLSVSTCVISSLSLSFPVFYLSQSSILIFVVFFLWIIWLFSQFFSWIPWYFRIISQCFFSTSCLLYNPFGIIKEPYSSSLSRLPFLLSFPFVTSPKPVLPVFNLSVLRYQWKKHTSPFLFHLQTSSLFYHWHTLILYFNFRIKTIKAIQIMQKWLIQFLFWTQFISICQSIPRIMWGKMFILINLLTICKWFLLYTFM